MGFKALDDLFKSTVAKPKLYFLPVAKNIADKRSRRLGDLRGGPAKIGDEMRDIASKTLISSLTRVPSLVLATEEAIG
jgi:hypothetical protein